MQLSRRRVWPELKLYFYSILRCHSMKWFIVLQRISSVLLHQCYSRLFDRSQFTHSFHLWQKRVETITSKSTFELEMSLLAEDELRCGAFFDNSQAAACCLHDQHNTAARSHFMFSPYNVWLNFLRGADKTWSFTYRGTPAETWISPDRDTLCCFMKDHPLFHKNNQTFPQTPSRKMI